MRVVAREHAKEDARRHGAEAVHAHQEAVVHVHAWTLVVRICCEVYKRPKVTGIEDAPEPKAHVQGGS